MHRIYIFSIRHNVVVSFLADANNHPDPSTVQRWFVPGTTGHGVYRDA